MRVSLTSLPSENCGAIPHRCQRQAYEGQDDEEERYGFTKRKLFLTSSANCCEMTGSLDETSARDLLSH